MTILYLIAVGLICFLLGMIVDSMIINVKIKEPEAETEQKTEEQNLEVIEINDPDNYFIPF